MFMVKILILDIGNGMNKGNLALLYSTIDTINKFVHDAEFVVMYYGDTGSHSNIGLKEQQLIGKFSAKKPNETLISFLYALKCIYISLLYKLGIHYSISKQSRLFEYYDSDLVLIIGGDTMSGDYGFRILMPFINISYALLLGKQTVLYGESIGYYNNRILSYVSKFIFNRISLILLRDKLSLKYIEENHIKNPNVYLTADSAFALNPASQSRVHEVLLMEGISKLEKPLIGVNVSKLISKYRGNNMKNDAIEIADLLAKTIDNLVENLETNILMIPHVYEPGAESDDRVAINTVFEKVKNKSKVYVIKNEYNPQELKGIIGLCDLFIGARMHSTIASTSMLVPTVGIAYSHKMYGIIGKMLGQEEYILDIKELDYDKLISKIYAAWENREKIRSDLEVRIPVVKEKVLLNGKYVSELLTT